MTDIKEGSLWVSKDGKRTVRIKYASFSGCDVINVVTGRISTLTNEGLQRNYFPAVEVVDQ